MDELNNLLQRYPAAVSHKDDTGAIPLHYIARNSQCPFENLKLLGDTYPEGLRQQDNSGDLPLHCAIPHGHSKARQKSVSIGRMMGRSFQAVKDLLDSYPNGSTQKNNDGFLPVHLAVQQGCMDVLKLLVEYNQVGLEVRDNAGNLPLHIAVAPKAIYKPNIITFLVDKHKESLDYRQTKIEKSKKCALKCGPNIKQEPIEDGEEVLQMQEFKHDQPSKLCFTKQESQQDQSELEQLKRTHEKERDALLQVINEKSQLHEEVEKKLLLQEKQSKETKGTLLTKLEMQKELLTIRLTSSF